MTVEPGEHLTKKPSPRVLVQLSRDGVAERIAKVISEFAPTVQPIKWTGEVNLNEWDVLVTREVPAEFTSEDVDDGRRSGSSDEKQIHKWSQSFPSHLCVVLIVPSTRRSLEVIDLHPPKGSGENLPPVAIVQDESVVGSHVRYAKGLPESLDALIRETLAPAVRKRTEHAPLGRYAVDMGEGAESDALPLRPFLFGPDDCILAGSYERSDQASVWMIPDDCPDIPAWTREALREWSVLYPKRFPKIPDWDRDDAWKSATELDVIARMDALHDDIMEKAKEYEAANAALETELEVARDRANSFERALLTADGDDLVDAVACAFGVLGFHVVDMDEHWPDNDRREDLRVFIDGDEDWVAIVEVKGFTKGVKETELQAFGRWAERFILEHQRMPDRRWFVANHDRKRDPSQRREPFSHKPAIVEVFRAQDGLIIDTTALFAAVRLVQAQPERREEIAQVFVEILGLMHSLPNSLTS